MCGGGGEDREFIKTTRGLSLSKVFELSLFVPIAELSITFTFFPVSVKLKKSFFALCILLPWYKLVKDSPGFGIIFCVCGQFINSFEYFIGN